MQAHVSATLWNGLEDGGSLRNRPPWSSLTGWRCRNQAHVRGERNRIGVTDSGLGKPRPPSRP